MQFDTVTVTLVALLAGLIGYVVGALRVASAGRKRRPRFGRFAGASAMT